ncbi:MAG: response regulator [Acidobacteria bacterium]|nr:response regulator [Acidobacteriota bacterium]
MRALVVDDEVLARRLVVEMLATHPEVTVVGECSNGFEAVKAVSETKPDLLFLDVQMPRLSGFEVLELLEAAPEPRPAVIFLTAYDQYALRAFEVNAVDYLLKPFSQSRFDAALDRARERVAAVPSAATTLSDAARAPGTRLDRIAIRDGTTVFVLPLAELSYVRAQDDYVLLVSHEREHLKQQTLASLEAQLPPERFVRIHRSFLLNVERLARLEPGTAVLRDGTKLPVSRTGAQRLRALLGESEGA